MFFFSVDASFSIQTLPRKVNHRDFNIYQQRAGMSIHVYIYYLLHAAICVAMTTLAC